MLTRALQPELLCRYRERGSPEAGAFLDRYQQRGKQGRLSTRSVLLCFP